MNDAVIVAAAPISDANSAAMGMEILLNSIAIGPSFSAGGVSADHINAT
jgi:hypothetical protein